MRPDTPPPRTPLVVPPVDFDTPTGDEMVAIDKGFGGGPVGGRKPPPFRPDCSGSGRASTVGLPSSDVVPVRAEPEQPEANSTDGTPAMIFDQFLCLGMCADAFGGNV